MIVTQFDDKYLPWAHVFLKSLAITNPDEEVYLNTVNVTTSDAETLREFYPHVTIETCQEEVPDKAYMANRKIGVFLSVLQRFSRPTYMLIDTDVLFRHSLQPLFDKLADADAAIIFRDGKWGDRIYEHLKVASGIILVQPSGIQLIENWNHIAKTEKILSYIPQGNWYWDQLALLEATRKTPLRYATIEESLYIDKDFDPQSFIWSAHHPAKQYMFNRFSQELVCMKSGDGES